MNAATVRKLIDLNRQFYQTFAVQFATTRSRLQPGVRNILAGLSRNADILDLGCGNGAVPRWLAHRPHRGTYTGLDFSPELINLANEDVAYSLNASFHVADLTDDNWDDVLSIQEYDVIFAFSVLHHIPDRRLRFNIMQKARDYIKSGGCLYLSNWQFLNSPRLRARIIPWDKADILDQDVDPGDYLLDWRHGGYALRYVHHFDVMELELLAKAAGFQVRKTFLSDGEGGVLGLYQAWEPA